MPFDPDKFLAQKPGFDPDAFLAKSEPRTGEAALEGFGSAALAGYAPQVGAAVGGLIPDPGAAQDEELRAQGFKVSEQPGYTERRDALIQRQEGLQKEASGAYLAGQVGGALASAPMLTRSLGLGGKGVGALMKAGAVEGAIQNPGDVEGQVNPLQLKERAQGAAGGAATAGVMGAVAKPLGVAAKALQPESLKAFGAQKAFKSAGPILKDVRKAAERGRIEKVGEAMIRHNVVKPGATFEDIAEHSNQLKEEAGSAIGNLYKKADDEARAIAASPVAGLSPEKQLAFDATELSPTMIADGLDAKFAAELKGRPEGAKTLASIRGVLDDLKMNGEKTDIATLQRFKEDLDDQIKYNRGLLEEPLRKQYLFHIRDEIKNKIQSRIDALDGVLGSSKLKDLKDANDAYGTWAEVSRISKDRVNRESANRMMSLTDTMAGVGGGVGGAITGGLLGGDPESALKGAAIGAGAGLLNKGGRLYGNPILARGAYGLGSALDQLPPGLMQAPQKAMGLLQTPEAGVMINRLRGQK